MRVRDKIFGVVLSCAALVSCATKDKYADWVIKPHRFGVGSCVFMFPGEKEVDSFVVIMDITKDEFGEQWYKIWFFNSDTYTTIHQPDLDEVGSVASCHPVKPVAEEEE